MDIENKATAFSNQALYSIIPIIYDRLIIFKTVCNFGLTIYIFIFNLAFIEIL